MGNIQLKGCGKEVNIFFTNMSVSDLKKAAALFNKNVESLKFIFCVRKSCSLHVHGSFSLFLCTLLFMSH